jgi:NitT/TauT family transport system permease protein
MSPGSPGSAAARPEPGAVPGPAPRAEAVPSPGWRPSAQRIRLLISGAVGITLWWVVARLIVNNSLFLPTPAQVLKEAIQITASGELLHHIWVSTLEFVLGAVAGVVLGVLAGLPMAVNRVAFDYLDPWLSGLYTTPLVALTPLFIIWFGIGLTSKVVIIFLLVMFPVTMNTIAGIRSVDDQLVNVALSFGGTKQDILRKVMIPWAVPFILSGARIGAGRGVVGIFVAELFAGAGAGVGWLITAAGQVFNTALLFVGVIVLACFGLVVTSLLRILERRIAPWRPTTTI